MIEEVIDIETRFCNRIDIIRRVMQIIPINLQYKNVTPSRKFAHLFRKAFADFGLIVHEVPQNIATYRVIGKPKRNQKYYEINPIIQVPVNQKVRISSNGYKFHIEFV